MPNKLKPEGPSWFFKWFLNNKMAIVLLNSCLILVLIWLLTKVVWLIKPLQELTVIIGLPLVFSAVLYYLLTPLIDLMAQKWHWHRAWSITLLFIVILVLMIWGIAKVIPVIQTQTTSLINSWPLYWHNIQQEVQRWFEGPNFKSIQRLFNEANTNMVKDATAQLNTMVSSTFSHIGTAVGVVTNVVIALVTTPFILFFMLKDGHQLKGNIVKFFPPKVQTMTDQVLHEINGQLSQYIRGQLTVAFWVAVMFTVGYWIVGMKYALTLGLLAGLLNLIPYLGSFLAMVPSIIIAAFISPALLIRVLLVFAVEQTLESRIVSPLVIGSKMAMYPVTTIIVLLAAGKLFGLAGVIIGIPVYAILKILIGHLFEWFKKASGLYE